MNRQTVAVAGMVILMAYLVYALWLRTKPWETVLVLALAAVGMAAGMWRYNEIVQTLPLVRAEGNGYMWIPSEARWATMLCLLVGVVVGAGWVWRLYGAWVLGRVSLEEGYGDMRGVRGWLRPVNVALMAVFVVCMWVGLDWPMWLTGPAGLAALLVYPVMNGMGMSELEEDAGAEERRRVLTMVEMGKISGEDAAELIAALRPAGGMERPRGRAGFSIGRRMMAVGAALVTAGFFLPWFRIVVEREVMREMAVGLGAPADLKFGDGIVATVSGGDLSHGMGWVVLAMGIVPVLLPVVWPGERDEAHKRGLTVGALCVGTLLLLYVMSQGMSVAAVGLYAVICGYAALWAGALRTFIKPAPRVVPVVT